MPRIAIAAAIALAAFATPALAQQFDPMQFADGDHDGKVTLAEYTAFLSRGWDYRTNSADKVKPADLPERAQRAFAGVPTDADGYVTKAAYLAAAPDRFRKADTNGDGTLDSAELRASMGMPAG
jgi:Ca2+-binding EF-hand superfamily protein